MKIVKAVIQVVGPQKMPTVPMSSDDIRNWCRQYSYLIVPQTHPMFGPQATSKDLRRHKAIIPIKETRPIKLIATGLPAIQDIVGQATARKPVNETTVTNPPTTKDDA